MMADDRLARGTALAIGLGALIGMVPPLQNALARGDGLPDALWALLRFFTIVTNLMVAIVFLRIASGGRDAVKPIWLGCVVLAILLVGVVFNLVLGQMPQPSWWSRIGDSLHHHVAPLAVPLWWLIFARYGALGWRAPWLWSLYPLAYCAYILTRATLEPAGLPGRIPYFFMDAARLGWPTAIANMAAIAAGFVLAGHGLVVLDRALARRQRP